MTEDGDRASAQLILRWTVPGIGPWTTRTRVALAKGDGDAGWKVRWSPQVIHRELTAETRLGTAVDAPERGAIVDRDGAPIVQNRLVVDLAVQTSKVRDARATAQRLATILDLDAGDLEQRIADAPKGRYLSVISLRKDEYDDKAEQLAAVPGLTTNQRRAPLAPSKGFARALLGAVGPATAEQVKASEGRLKAGDETGQWGLQRRFDAQLRGTPSRRIVTRDITTGGLADALYERKGRDGMTLRTTLDRDAQRAAETALGATGRKAALVAVQPSTGDILAVANRPTDQTYDRALEGLYPPGSTFKIVTTAELLESIDPDEFVGCPKTRTVNGRSFRNFEGGGGETLPFREAFAQSCNTAFIGLATILDDDQLTRGAKRFGLGRRVELGLPVGASKVPEPDGEVAKAAMTIGQDKIVVTPLAMAGVAATVADGRWRAPRLIRGGLAGDGASGAQVGKPLNPWIVRPLRQLMRAVVTGGTGTALASVPGEPRGKSGTAEYGGGDPPPTHAWFVAYRGDVALAVLVEGGQSGGRVAAPIAARFLTALGGAG